MKKTLEIIRYEFSTALKRKSYLFFAFGIMFIMIAQGVFWFNLNLKAYSRLHKNIPLARISFRESESERPRMFPPHDREPEATHYQDTP